MVQCERSGDARYSVGEGGRLCRRKMARVVAASAMRSSPPLVGSKGGRSPWVQAILVTPITPSAANGRSGSAARDAPG